MRILLTHHFPLDGADSGLATYDLAQGLVRSGHLVRLLVLDLGGSEDVVDVYDTLTVRRVVCRPGKAADLPFELPGFSAAPGDQPTFSGLSTGQLAAYREVLRRELDREVDAFNPHLIHAQHVWVQAQLALESGVPYVVRAWGPELEGEQSEVRYHALAEQAADNASRIFVASAALGKRVRRAYERCAERIVVVPPAVDERRLAMPPKRGELLARWGVHDPAAKVVVVAGPLVLDSGFDLLLNAAARYAQTHPRAMTLIAGVGPQRTELESQAERLGLESVRFLGQLNRDALTALYQSASVAVQPAAEAASWVGAASALAAGAPVIAIAGSGLEELVTNATGELVAAADHELLAETIGRALDENWRHVKGPAGQRLIAEKFSLDVVVARHVEHYTALLGERFGDSAADE